MTQTQMELFLCIWILYQIISLTATNEDSDESRASEDKVALHQLLSKTTLMAKEQGTEEVLDNARDNFALTFTPTENSPGIKEEDKEYEAEKKLGDMANLFGTNQHYSYPDLYKYLGRRFVLQYPYKEISNINEDEEAEMNFDKTAKEFMNNNLAESHLIPVKASPELVLAVAAKAALVETAIPRNPSNEKIIDKEILRSGNYWNDVWREDVNPDILRTRKDKVIESVNVKVMPGSKLYKLVSELKRISPRLIYVINKE